MEKHEGFSALPASRFQEAQARSIFINKLTHSFPAGGSMPRTAQLQVSDDGILKAMETLKSDVLLTKTFGDLGEFDQKLMALYNSAFAASNSLSAQTKEKLAAFIDASIDWMKRKGAASSASVTSSVTSIPQDGLKDYATSNESYSNLKTGYANFIFVSGIFSGQKIPEKDIDAIASFKGECDEANLPSRYTHAIIAAMAVSPEAGYTTADLQNVRFGKDKGLADQYSEILKRLPLFTAIENTLSQDGSGTWNVSFRLQKGKAPGASEFTAPQELISKTQALESQQEELHSTAYKFSSKKTFKLGAEEVVDSIPAAMAAEQDLLSSKKTGEVPMSQIAAVKYGTHYIADPTSTKSQSATATSANLLELAHLYNFEVTLPLNEWLASDKGQEFIAKLNKSYEQTGKQITITGTADMLVFYQSGKEAEFSTALKKNNELACERATYGYNAITDINKYISENGGSATFDMEMFSTKGKVNFFQDFAGKLPKGVAESGYVQGEGTAHLQSLMEYLESASKGEKRKFELTDEANLKNQQDALKYYNELLSSGAIKKEGNSFSLGSLSLCNEYFRRKKGEDNTLRKGEGSAKGMLNEGAYNIFVQAICESGDGSARTVSLTSSVDADLRVKIESFDKEAGTAILSTEYYINGLNVGLSQLNGDLAVFFQKATEDGKADYSNLAFLTATPIEGQPGKFRVEGIPLTDSGKLIAYAETGMGTNNECFSSGYVWQELKVVPPPQIIEEIKNPVKVDIVPSSGKIDESSVGSVDLPVHKPGNLVMSSDVLYRDEFNNAFEQILVDKYGFSRDPYTLQLVSPSGSLSGPEYIAIFNEWKIEMQEWCNLPHVSAYIQSQLAPGNSYEEFVSLLTQMKFADAAKLLNEDSLLAQSLNAIANSQKSNVKFSSMDLYDIMKAKYSASFDITIPLKKKDLKYVYKGKEFYEAYKNESGAYTEKKTTEDNTPMFDEQNLAKLDKLSKRKSTGSDMTVTDKEGNRYTAKKAKDGVQLIEFYSPKYLNLYVRDDLYMLLTDQNINVASGGATLLMKIDLGNLDIVPYAGAGALYNTTGSELVLPSFSKTTESPFSGYMVVGAKGSVRLNDFLTALVDLNATRHFSKKTTPIDAAGASAGLQVELGGFDVKVMFSRRFMPKEIPSDEISVGVNYDFGRMKVGGSVGWRLKDNVEGNKPISLSVTGSYMTR
jgi:hypothetical protein